MASAARPMSAVTRRHRQDTQNNSQPSRRQGPNVVSQRKVITCDSDKMTIIPDEDRGMSPWSSTGSPTSQQPEAYKQQWNQSIQPTSTRFAHPSLAPTRPLPFGSKPDHLTETFRQRPNTAPRTRPVISLHSSSIPPPSSSSSSSSSSSPSGGTDRTSPSLPESTSCHQPPSPPPIALSNRSNLVIDTEESYPTHEAEIMMIPNLMKSSDIDSKDTNNGNVPENYLYSAIDHITTDNMNRTVHRTCDENKQRTEVSTDQPIDRQNNDFTSIHTTSRYEYSFDPPKPLFTPTNNRIEDVMMPTGPVIPMQRTYELTRPKTAHPKQQLIPQQPTATQTMNSSMRGPETNRTPMSDDQLTKPLVISASANGYLQSSPSSYTMTKTGNMANSNNTYSNSSAQQFTRTLPLPLRSLPKHADTDSSSLSSLSQEFTTSSTIVSINQPVTLRHPLSAKRTFGHNNTSMITGIPNLTSQQTVLSLPPSSINNASEKVGSVRVRLDPRKAAMRIWWLEENCRLLQSSINEHTKAVSTGDALQKRCTALEKDKEALILENTHLSAALADLHSQREARLEELKNDLKSIYLRQSKQIAERNDELTRSIREKNAENVGLKAALNEREELVGVLKRERDDLLTQIKEAKNNLRIANERLQEWEEFCSREQANAAKSLVTATNSQTEAHELAKTKDALQMELSTAKSQIATAEGKVSALREVHSDVSKKMNELKTQLERMHNRAARAETLAATKETELEMAQKQNALQLESQQQLENQLAQAEREIETLKLKTGSHDKLVEAHRTKEHELEGKIRVLKDALAERDRVLTIHMNKIEEIIEARSRLEGELIAAQRTQTTLQQEVADGRHHLGRAETEVQAMRARLHMLEDDLKVAQSKVDALSTKNSQLESSLRDSEVARASLVAQDQDLQGKLRDLASSKTLLESNFQTQGVELRGLTKQYIALQNEISACKAELSAKNESLSTARFERDRVEAMLQTQVVTLEKRLISAGEKLAEVQGELVKVRVEKESEAVQNEREIKLLKKQLARRLLVQQQQQQSQQQSILSQQSMNRLSLSSPSTSSPAATHYSVLPIPSPSTVSSSSLTSSSPSPSPSPIPYELTHEQVDVPVSIVGRHNPPMVSSTSSNVTTSLTPSTTLDANSLQYNSDDDNLETSIKGFKALDNGLRARSSSLGVPTKLNSDIATTGASTTTSLVALNRSADSLNPTGESLSVGRECNV